MRHVVYTSFFGAGPYAAFTLARDHGATEQAIIRSGMDFTLLRDNFYADVMPDFVGADGVIRGPARDGRVALLAVDDVVDVAVTVLRDPSQHRDTAYSLTGPEALTLADVAAVISKETGRPVTYVDETLAQAYASRSVYGAPRWQVDAWVSTYTAIAAGELAEVTDLGPRHHRPRPPRPPQGPPLPGDRDVTGPVVVTRCRKQPQHQ